MVLILAVIGLGFVTILDLDSADADDSSEEVYIVQFVVDGVIVQTCTSDNVIVPANPTKEGARFLNWTVDGVFCNPANYGYSEDVKFTAAFEEYTYTVTYMAGGQIVGTPQTVKHGDLILAPGLPAGYESWDYDFSKGVTQNMIIMAVKAPEPENTENGSSSYLYVGIAVAILAIIGLIAIRKIRNS